MWASLVNFIAPEPTQEDLVVSALQREGHHACEALDDLLQQRGADSLAQMTFSDGDLNLFQTACLYGNIEAAMKMYELGLFQLDARTANGGNTAAHLAAMNGHARLLVDYLVGQLGAPLGVKNNKGQNVYEVCPSSHLQLKQTLMTMLLQEEQRTGTAPELGGIPVTRDNQAEEERLRNLPPPPIFAATASSAPPPQQYIQPDGFVTTVGNPQLAQKYGNVQVQSRLHAAAAATSPQQQQPPRQVIAPPPPQFTAGGAPPRYVPVGVNVAPSSRPPPTAQFRPLATTGAKVFNPQQQ